MATYLVHSNNNLTYTEQWQQNNQNKVSPETRCYAQKGSIVLDLCFNFNFREREIYLWKRERFDNICHCQEQPYQNKPTVYKFLNQINPFI